MLCFFVFFFQAEDGIRDYKVTGVQTCALPIYKVEYLGLDKVDGDDAYELKVTLKNGDIVYYYLDPDTYLEIKKKKQQFIRGSVRESEQDLGSYKQVAGVYYPFSIEAGSKDNPGDHARITFDKIEANVPLDDSYFKMTA